MSYTISMDKAGRIVIPKEVRERLGADETTRFNLDIILDRIELTPKEDATKLKAQLIRKNGRLVVVGAGKPHMSVVEALRQDREERIDFLAHPESHKP